MEKGQERQDTKMLTLSLCGKSPGWFKMHVDYSRHAKWGYLVGPRDQQPLTPPLEAGDLAFAVRSRTGLKELAVWPVLIEHFMCQALGRPAPALPSPHSSTVWETDKCRPGGAQSCTKKQRKCGDGNGTQRSYFKWSGGDTLK